MKEKKIIIGSLLALAFVFYAFMPFFEYQDEWEVPAKYQKLKNPVVADDEAMDIGSELYSKHCKSCHGKTGLGDGPKSAELDTDCGDFTTAEFQKQSDGSLFYKTTFGRDDMPSFEKKISDDEERWMIVYYIRSLEEK
jgi:mono/diheme cytochrome c family protein